MGRLRCEVLERDAAGVPVVRDEGGRVLRLYTHAPPPGATWIGTIDGAGAWAEPATPPPTAPADPEVVWLDTLALEARTLDEVGVVVGPDRGDGLGLFDSPTTASTGEHTEGPSPDNGDRASGEQRRTAVLAWIAAQAADAPVPTEGGGPCEPLKRLIADEPLDPLPALDGVPRPRPPPAEPRPELAPEREDTATQIEGFEAMVERRGESTASESAPRVPADPPSAGRLASPRNLLALALAVVLLAWAMQAVWG